MTRVPLIGVSCDFEAESGRSLVRARYHDTLEALGAACVLIPPTLRPDRVEALLERLDGVLLSGGVDLYPEAFGQELHPRTNLVARRRHEADLLLGRHLLERGLPVLGLCLGMQVLAVVRGGTLHQYLPDVAGEEVCHRSEDPGLIHHEVDIAEGSLLHRITGLRSFPVNTHHQQAVWEPGEGLAVTARARDGVVEAIEGTDGAFVLGLQWHPEKEPDDPQQAAILEAFVERCRRGR